MFFLGQLRHPNLVNLIGYCLEDEQRLLVYEYMEGGNLENLLFKGNFNREDSWMLCFFLCSFEFFWVLIGFFWV